MDQVDLGILPKGQLAWRAFVEAAGAVDDSAERYFLELKSDVDLNTKAGRAKVAKFVLGALNRMPDHAARRFEGYALMVLGVSRGVIAGIPAFEALQLDGDVQKFAGAGVRPRWDYHTVPIKDGHSVVIIQVSPPQWGDRPLVCRADGDGLVAGDVYIRADGNTRKATAGELDQLHDRMSGGVSAEPYVQISGNAYRFSINHADLREAFEQRINAKAAELLDAVKLPPAGLALQAFYHHDTRGVDAFRREVESWAKKSTSAFKSVLNRVARSSPAFQVGVGVTEPRLVLTGVEVDIQFGDDVHVFPHMRLTGHELLRLLPDPPAAYGENGAFSDRWIASRIEVPEQTKLHPIGTDGRVIWTESSPQTISVKFNDVRPTKPRYSLEDTFILITNAGPETSEIRAQWTVSAIGHDRVYQGELVVPIMDADLTEPTRRALGLAGS